MRLEHWAGLSRTVVVLLLLGAGFGMIALAVAEPSTADFDRLPQVVRQVVRSFGAVI